MSMAANEGLPKSPMGSFSPLKSNLEDMILSCGALDKHIAMMHEDKECFGLLTEDSYCYDAPQVLTQLQKISRVAALCTRDISIEDEAFETDESSLTLVLYNFISEHKRILDQLTALQSVMKTTGSLYGAFGVTLNRQREIVNNFRTALDSRYPQVKVRAAPNWIDETESLRSCVEAYPIPSE